jgi:hypothetical protein
MMATIEKMTVEELKQLITQAVAEAVDERLTKPLGDFEISEDELFQGEEADTRSWEQVKQDIEQHRWTPPPSTPSVTDLLREDRDS